MTDINEQEIPKELEDQARAIHALHHLPFGEQIRRVLLLGIRHAEAKLIEDEYPEDWDYHV